MREDAVNNLLQVAASIWRLFQLDTLIEISVIHKEIPGAEPVGGLGWKEMVR